MELQSKLFLPVAKTVFGTLKNAYQYRQQQRVEDFLKGIDLCYETMPLDNQRLLNEHIKSQIGQDILADFADAILQTSSRRVRMALAILYCEDREFIISNIELQIFVGAMTGITDDLIEFFLMSVNLKCQTEHSPYPRASIHYKNFEPFVKKGWDEETIFTYTHDLIRRRLLLPDSTNYQSQGSTGEGWAVWFGITDRSRRMASLLVKADGLLSNET